MRDLTELCLLAKKHETDKGGRHLRYGGGDSDTCHEYTPIYYDLLDAKRESVTRVLEVGVNAGSSLRMWREFFPNAHIFGLDSNGDCLFHEDRITCIAADQGNAQSLVQAVALAGAEPFDLIVEDGSHELGHQILTAQILVPWLSAIGIYVCEDMHEDCHPELVAVPVMNVIGYHYRWYPIRCEMGIGKAHCHCASCGGKQPEQLLVFERR